MGSYQLTTDSFKFREHLKRTMKRDDARDELIQSLADSWEDASSLRQALSPMGAAAAAGELPAARRLVAHHNVRLDRAHVRIAQRALELLDCAA